MEDPRAIPVLRYDMPGVTSSTDVDPLAREVYAKNEKSVVRITVTSPDGSTFGGSGVLVKDKDGVSIVTNAHVGANARSIQFSNSAGESFAARLDKFDDLDDLATLKPDGVKINPALAVDIGDPSKLKPNEMLYALGHPRGYDVPVLSQGTFAALDSYANLAPQTGDQIREAVSGLYKGNKAYVKDGEDFANSPRVSASLPADHGNSGGPLLDKQGKLEGIVEAQNDDGSKTLSVSSAKVKALLDDPHYKFQFDYSRKSLADQAPLATTVKGLGLVGLAATPLSRRVIAPVAGLYYGAQALDDIKVLSHDNLYDSRAHYVEKLAADGGAFAAGLLTFVPRFRLAGTVLVGARLAVDALTDFTQTTPVLNGYKRSDGSKGQPLFWTSSHH
jgi:hypothetical protein